MAWRSSGQGWRSGAGGGALRVSGGSLVGDSVRVLGGPDNLAGQWHRDGSPISGATDPAGYVRTVDDVGAVLTFEPTSLGAAAAATLHKITLSGGGLGSLTAIAAGTSHQTILAAMTEPTATVTGAGSVTLTPTVLGVSDPTVEGETFAGARYDGASPNAQPAALTVSANIVVGPAPPAPTVPYWDGVAALIDTSYTQASSTLVIAAVFDWPDASGGEQHIIAVNDGRQNIRVLPDNRLNVSLNSAIQRSIATDIGASPGDRVAVMIQRESGVSRPFLVYQINDGTPVVSGSFSDAGFQSANWIGFGRNTTATSGNYYEGRMYRAAVWVDGTGGVYSDLGTGIRDLVDASGDAVDRAVSVAALGIPTYDLDMTVDGLNAGTNLGSENDLAVAGVFATGVPSSYFEIVEV